MNKTEDGFYPLTATCRRGCNLATLLHENSSCLPQLTMLGRVGSHLAELLADETLGPEFQVSLQDSPVAETLFDEDPAYLGIRLALENSLCQLVESWPKHR